MSSEPRRVYWLVPGCISVVAGIEKCCKTVFSKTRMWSRRRYCAYVVYLALG